MTDGSLVTLADVLDAASKLVGVIRRTPIIPAESIGQTTDCDLYLKAENLQLTGAFKLRGAFNRVATLSAAERERGVITASAGNHAQGVALAAQSMGVAATIVMPVGAPHVKVEATRSYGARVVLHGQNFDEAYAYSRELEAESRAIFIHPFEDRRVIAGQGTIAVEMLRDLPDADALVIPVGGGGLIAGVAAAAKALKPDVRVYGVQAATVASAARSFVTGQLTAVTRNPTIADGIAVGQCGELTFAHISRLVDDVITVSEDDIRLAMVTLLERARLLVEGAGAVGLAALLSGRLRLPGRRVALLLSGGNVDLSTLTGILGGRV